MSKFRKKPIAVEAFQMTKERRASNADWPEWMNQAGNKDRGEVGSLQTTEEGTSGVGTLSIVTREGEMKVDWSDYIIQGVKGELYPCKPDIFEATYDVVEDIVLRGDGDAPVSYVDGIVRGSPGNGEFMSCDDCVLARYKAFEARRQKHRVDDGG